MIWGKESLWNHFSSLFSLPFQKHTCLKKTTQCFVVGSQCGCSLRFLVEKPYYTKKGPPRGTSHAWMVLSVLPHNYRLVDNSIQGLLSSHIIMKRRKWGYTFVSFKPYVLRLNSWKILSLNTYNRSTVPIKNTMLRPITTLQELR